jgi:hypothetical protein
MSNNIFWGTKTSVLCDRPIRPDKRRLLAVWLISRKTGFFIGTKIILLFTGAAAIIYWCWLLYKVAS